MEQVLAILISDLDQRYNTSADTDSTTPVLLENTSFVGTSNDNSEVWPFMFYGNPW